MNSLLVLMQFCVTSEFGEEEGLFHSGVLAG